MVRRHEQISTKDDHPSKIYDMIKEYSEYSTVQGIIYIFMTKYGIIGKTFWTLVVLAVSVLAIYWSLKAYKDWQESLVLTTVNTTAYPIKDIEFPSITICNPGSSAEVLQAGVFKEFFDYLTDNGLSVNLSPLAAAKLMNQVFSQPNKTDDSNTLEELLTDVNRQAFLNAKFPGMTINDGSITDLIKLITSKNPETMIKSKVIIDGGYNPCRFVNSSYASSSYYKPQSLRRKRSPTTNKCTSGYVYDESNRYCYKTLGLSNDASSAKALCNKNDGSLLSFDNNDQVLGFLNLTSTGKLNFGNGSSTFFVSAQRIPPNSYIFDGEYYPISNSTFPSIELVADSSYGQCVQGSISATKLTTTLKLANCATNYLTIVCRAPELVDVGSDCNGTTYMGESTQSDNSLEYTFNQTLRDENTKAKAQLRSFFQNIFSRLDLTRSYESIFSMLWYSTIPCFDVESITSSDQEERGFLHTCIWKGIALPCSAVFTQFPTDIGMCCNFNMPAADEIFNSKKYSDLIKKLQTFDRNNSFEDKTLPDQYKGEPISQAGESKGLMIVLDNHQDQYDAGSVDQDINGFPTLLSPKGSFPLLNVKSIVLQPGMMNYVPISAVKISAKDELRHLNPKDRDCYFTDEYKLVLHKNYTQNNCLFECGLKLSGANNANSTCTPWYLPSLTTPPKLCNPWEASDFVAYLSNNVPDGACSYCLPDCETTIYSSWTNSVPFRRCDEANLGVSIPCDIDNTNTANPRIWGQQVIDEYIYRKQTPPIIVKSSMRNYPKGTVFSNPKMESTYDAYQKDIGVGFFYFQDSVTFQYVRQPRLSWTDFFASIGGLLGLCMGASIVTFIEIIWLCLNVGANAIKPISQRQKN